MRQNKLNKIYNNRLLQHILFWLVSYYILLYFFANSKQVEKIDYIYAALFHINLIIAVYLNLLILIPKLLSKKKFFFYIVCLLLLISGSAELNILFFDKPVDIILPEYYFISYYEFPDILKFVVIYIAVTSLIKLAKSWFKLLETNKTITELQKEKIEIELKALRSQVNPHFLFNSLNVLYSLALKKAEETPETIIKLSDILRYVIYDSNKEKVNIKSEIELINNYLNLQKYRTDSDSEIIFETDIRHEIQITPMLFLPLVENSFKHGIKGDILNTYVRISLFASNEELKFEIENNKGASDSPIEKTDGGVGLQNIRQRLNLLYPDNHEFVIYENENIFKVLLKLNYEN